MDQTIENGKDGGFSVYEFGEYPESSVLAGQTTDLVSPCESTTYAARAAPAP